ncbi:TniQ family protein [Variovorax sp. J22G73]|uniref:TniQ family protein n=1 Tax=unclassified Variovorax TaxID=663243 RepID=UPI002577FF01|nr:MULTISPECIES: TniQ family protein [unclassified Variovorax]MDM0007482.1 TniQ family protein [Variovorax sp. J22R203]MDM0100158.1 TniQ family protein [Variovorax sp. J22G73]
MDTSQIEEQFSLWPFHFKPLEDELLSIWLIRLAHAHGYKVEQLCTLLLGRGRRLWNSDIDKFQPPHLRWALKRVTGITDAQLNAASLHSFEGYISEYFNAHGSSRWIVPLHIYHRRRKSPGLCYCPACLTSSSIPYFRRAWRLSFITVCPQHRVELLDSCPSCTAPLAPHRVDIGPDGFEPGPKRIVYCAQCGNDLRKGAAIPAEQSLVDWTARLLMASDCGYMDWGRRAGMNSVLFFDGLRLLVGAIRRRITRTGHESTGERDFDFLPVARRRVTMMQVGMAVGEGPEGLQAYARTHGIRVSDVWRSSEHAPFWLVEALASMKRTQHPERTKEEVDEIARVTRNIGHTASSKRQARRSFGLNVDDERADAFRSLVSNEAYELLIASVDRLTTHESRPEGRQALQQDKMVFALMRVMGWSAKRICRLTIDELGTLLPRPREGLAGGSLPEPRDPASVCSYLWWFIESIRPSIPGAKNTNVLVVSSTTGRPLGGNALWLRFHRAVTAARLTDEIPDLVTFRRSVGTLP